ncbi:MAG: hypothetical protein CMJ77_16665 [Planctomycetaceae bacterium]|nr:hypothetical protein [Planctomycetaceae bacterium]
MVRGKSSEARNLKTRKILRRRGATLVEFSIVLPVFLLLVFGIIEYGRLQMTVNLLKNACRQASRLGTTEGVSTSQAITRVTQILGPAMNTDDVTVLVKDASVFDGDGALPVTSSDYAALPTLELTDAEPRQLFLIRADIAYNDIALIPWQWMDGMVISGQAIMRHE